MRVDVAVVGGGATGVAVAWMLAEAGVPGVAVLEQQGLGSGASGAGLGLASACGRDPEEIRWAVRSLHLLSQLELPAPAAFRPTGLYVLAGPRAAPELRRRLELLASAGVEHEELSPRRGAQRLPLLDWREVELAAFLPGDGWLDAGAWARAVGRILRQRGLKVLEGTRALRIALARGRVEGIEAEGEVRRVAADVAVVAAGQGTRPLLQASAEGLGEDLDLPLEPYTARWTCWHLPGELPPAPVWDGEQGLAWRAGEGLVWAGDGQEPEELRERLARRLPAAAAAEAVRVWTHTLAAPPDWRPMVGPLRCEGLWVAAGVAGRPAYALAAGEAVAALVAGKAPPVPAEPFSPHRPLVPAPLPSPWNLGQEGGPAP